MRERSLDVNEMRTASPLRLDDACVSLRRWSTSLADLRGYCGPRGVSPANTERVTGGVGTNLISLFRIEIGRCLEKSSDEPHHLVVGSPRVIDVKIEVNLLLLVPNGPFWTYVVPGQLYTAAPLSGRVEHAVPVVVSNHILAEDPRPERALRVEVGRVEHDDASNYIHVRNSLRAYCGNRHWPTFDTGLGGGHQYPHAGTARLRSAWDSGLCSSLEVTAVRAAGRERATPARCYFEIVNPPGILRAYSDEICELARPEQLARPVPSCPAWTLGDLVFHVGAVHRFWTGAVAAQSTERPAHDGGDVDDDQLVEWFRGHTRELLATIERVGPDSPCWTWWGEPMTAGAVERHQVQEAAIHLWDARLACGVSQPVEFDVALDGVAEFLQVQRPAMVLPSANRIVFASSDHDGQWVVGHESLPAITVSGDASDLLLVLYGRTPLDSLVVDGDAVVVQAWLDSINLE